jgi:hypothetical protein
MGGGTSGSPGGTLVWVELSGGSAIYGFRPPLPAQAQVEALVITTRQLGSSTPMASGRASGPNLTAPQPAQADVFSIYNWESASWEPLPGGQEQVRVQPAARYVGPDGLVKVQVTAGTDRVLRFVMPELTVEGRVPA